MVGLGWYLDVLGSESHVFVFVFRGFLKKNRERGKTRIGPSPRRSRMAKKTTLRFTVAKPVLRRGEDTIQNGPKFLFCFRKSCIRSLIV